MNSVEHLLEENEQLRARIADLESTLIKQQRVVLKDGVPEDAVTRFWAKVDVSGGEEACWPWTAKSDRFHVTKRQAISNRRFAWLLAYGETWPTEIIVTCHNTLCMNPKHFAQTEEDKFWSYVKKADGDGCWEWQGGMVKKTEYGGRGYGAFAPKTGEITPAHRYAYELLIGPIPDGLLACHKCDNPRCVRPDHIFPGTDLDNMRDMIAKGRAGWQKARRSGEAGPKP